MTDLKRIFLFSILISSACEPFIRNRTMGECSIDWLIGVLTAAGYDADGLADKYDGVFPPLLVPVLTCSAVSLENLKKRGGKGRNTGGHHHGCAMPEAWHQT